MDGASYSRTRPHQAWGKITENTRTKEPLWGQALRIQGKSSSLSWCNERAWSWAAGHWNKNDIGVDWIRAFKRTRFVAWHSPLYIQNSVDHSTSSPWCPRNSQAQYLCHPLKILTGKDSSWGSIELRQSTSISIQNGVQSRRLNFLLQWLFESYEGMKRSKWEGYYLTEASLDFALAEVGRIRLMWSILKWSDEEGLIQ